MLGSTEIGTLEDPIATRWQRSRGHVNIYLRYLTRGRHLHLFSHRPRLRDSTFKAAGSKKNLSLVRLNHSFKVSTQQYGYFRAQLHSTLEGHPTKFPVSPSIFQSLPAAGPSDAGPFYGLIFCYNLPVHL